MNMYFSVILPIYNVEKYLGQCVESVLSQTFQDYELILVDDGAKDRSAQICDEYAAKDVRIKVIHKENGGQSDARNVGALSAKGKYIVYIDSDDYVIETNFLQDLYDHTCKQETDLVLYKFRKFVDGELTLAPCTYSLAAAAEIRDTDELLAQLVRADAFYASAWTKAIRRDLLIQSGVFFKKGITGEDNEWYLHLLTSCNCTISAIDKPYIAYRQRTGSTSHTTKLRNLTDYIEVIETWYEGIIMADISDIRKRALLGAMAKYYANLLICYVNTTDEKKKEYRNRIRELKFLLDYSDSKRPKLIRAVYSLVGFNGTIFALKLLQKMR